MADAPRPMFIANRPVHTSRALVVRDKHGGASERAVSQAEPAQIELAIRAAVDARREMRDLPGYCRRDVLEAAAQGIRARADELTRLLVFETGKCIHEARGEIGRMLDTFRVAAEEATRIYGELLPLDISPRARGLQCLVSRFPVGVCSFITPFNFPLNLAAHKIAPAIAAGCPWILKPAPAAPLTSLVLGEILAETPLPPGAFSIVVCDNETAVPLVEDERIALLSFTGSSAVGWELRRRAGRKRVLLELGGNAACIVDRDADIERVAERLTFGAFYQAGQSCISVQRVLVHRDVYGPLRERLVGMAASLKAGDPLDERTTLGPLIALREAERVESWIQEAVAAGARIVCGGARRGALVEPTWIENVPRHLKLASEEVFGPVALLEEYEDFETALRIVNESRYGLQAGVFTRDIGRALRAYRELEVGGVVLNNVPSLRVDSMPYGGVKDSGVGREGVRSMIAELTEPKTLLFNGGESPR